MLMKWRERHVWFLKTLPLCFATLTVLNFFTDILTTIKVTSLICFLHHTLIFSAGPCVILIGPVAGERHCDPQPRYLVDHHQWKLVDNLVVRGDDEVAIYHRQEKCQVKTWQNWSSLSTSLTVLKSVCFYNASLNWIEPNVYRLDTLSRLLIGQRRAMRISWIDPWLLNSRRMCLINMHSPCQLWSGEDSITQFLHHQTLKIVWGPRFCLISLINWWEN